MTQREKQIFRDGYALGFGETGDGWNAECPFEMNGRQFEEDNLYVQQREEALKGYIPASNHRRARLPKRGK